MAKRSNPYSEDYIQQSKTHIGIKQFNKNEDRLKKVYEKTLQLLYQGARKSQNDVLQCSEVSSTEKKDSNKLRQLFISKEGGLMHSGTLATSIPVQQCACSGLAVDKCSYCESGLCATCQQLCGQCLLLYCSKCSLNGSEGSEVCVSCYN